MIWRRARGRDGDEESDDAPADDGQALDAPTPDSAWINIVGRHDHRGFVAAEAEGTTFIHAGDVDPCPEWDESEESVTAGDPVADPGSPVTDLAEQRRVLIDLVIYAYDRTSSAGIRARLRDGLRGVGVSALEPDGEPFDATRHETGGSEATDDEALHGRIAETERAGFVDGERLIRDPIVVVYRRR